MDEKKVHRLDKRIDDLRTKIKGAEDLKTASEVFDRSTLMSLYHLAKRGHFDVLKGVIKTGKEANVLRAVTASGEDVAVKIYRVRTCDFNAMYKYLYGDPRFGRIKKDRRSIIHAWVKKEFKNLQRAGEAGASVPEVHAFRDNVLVMEFIGRNGEACPMVKDVEIEDPDGFIEAVLQEMKTIYCKAGLVHSDLSQYNILVRDRKPVVIDMGQAVIREHPMADEFLKRDVVNIARYFKNHGVSEKSIMDTLEGC